MGVVARKGAKSIVGLLPIPVKYGTKPLRIALEPIIGLRFERFQRTGFLNIKRFTFESEPSKFLSIG